jgi:hypothetical protein
MPKIIVGKGNRQWEIEFPCECNGHMTRHTGFVTPIGNNPENSDFFTYYGETGQQVIGFAGYFPKYVREAALKLARQNDVS